MAKDEKREDSVLFSLKELKRVGPSSAAPPDAATPESSPRATRPVSAAMRTHDADDDEAGALLSASLASLRQRVDDDKRKAEALRRALEEEQRLLGEQAQLEVALAEEEARRKVAAAARAQAEARVAKARAEGRRASEADLASAGVHAEPERPRGIVLQPMVAAALSLLIVGALAGLSYLAFGRTPVQKQTAVAPSAPSAAGVPIAPPALALDFGSEIGWLAVANVEAAPAVKADDEEETPSRPRRTRRRAQAAAGPEGEPAATPPPAQKRVVLPPKPTGGGFVY